MRNTGTYFDMRRSRNKIPLMQKLLNWGIVSWIAYNVYKIWVLHGSYRVLVNAFPALGR